jgi:hypothetical protein
MDPIVFHYKTNRNLKILLSFSFLQEYNISFLYIYHFTGE